MKGDHKFIKMRDQIEIHIQLVESGQKPWLLAVHGICEHLGRHQYLVDLFSHQYNLCLMDLRGHGRSMGPRGMVSSFQDYAKDLGEVVSYIHDKFEMQKFSLFGHSMGALIVSDFLQNFAHPHLYPGLVFLSAPPVSVGGALGEVIKFAPLDVLTTLSQIPLSMKVPKLVNLKGLSHDPRVELNYQNDELTIKKVETKLALELVRTSREVFSRPLRVPCPAYVCYGTEDTIISVRALVEYFTMIEKAFQVQSFEGAYHEVHNEIEKYRLPYFDYLKKSLSLENL